MGLFCAQLNFKTRASLILYRTRGGNWISIEIRVLRDFRCFNYQSKAVRWLSAFGRVMRMLRVLIP